MSKQALSLAILSLCALFISACAMAPFSEPHTARVLGEGHSEWGLTGGTPGYGSFSYEHGVTERLDVGGLLEFQGFTFMMGLSGKYLLTEDLENEDPLSLIFGLGSSGDTHYAYFGPIKSYRTTAWHEISLNARYNVFHWDYDSGSSDSKDSSDHIDDFVDEVYSGINGTYSYLSVDVSNSVWFSDHFGLTLSLGAATFVTKAEGTFGKAGIKAHFNY